MSVESALLRNAPAPWADEPRIVPGDDVSLGARDARDCGRCTSAGSIEFDICQVCLGEAPPVIATTPGKPLDAVGLRRRDTGRLLRLKRMPARSQTRQHAGV